MPNRWALRCGLALFCLGMMTGGGLPCWAGAVTTFQMQEPSLVSDPSQAGQNLAPILSSIQWWAEQQALRSHLLFPREVLESDVRIIEPGGGLQGRLFHGI